MSETESGIVNERAKTECEIRWVRFAHVISRGGMTAGKRWRPSNGATRTRGKTVSWRHP